MPGGCSEGGEGDEALRVRVREEVDRPERAT